MRNYALFECTAEQLLGDSFDDDALIFEDDVRWLSDGSLSTRHLQISKSQAKAIMHKIIEDDVVCEALRNGIEHARLNPNREEPTDGSHPQDPAKALIEERIIAPTLGASVPSSVVMHFVAIAYDYTRTHGGTVN